MARIGDLNSEQLLALVRAGDLGPQEILQVLRNPFCTIEVAQLAAESPRWLSAHAVRERLAGFRGLPLPHALNLLATLPWLSLLDLAKAPETPPVVRRHAEHRIENQLSQMSLGEKVALARQAHRPLFKHLLAAREAMVLIALLNNPRLIENDILVALNTTEVPADFTTALARHPRWGQYYRVSLALAECPHTPLPIALSSLVRLQLRDISRVATHPKVPEKVRAGARRLLAKKKSDRIVRR